MRAHAPTWRLHLLDAGNMLEQLPPTRGIVSKYPYGTLDGRHLHPWINIELLNVLMNAVRQAAGAERGRADSERDRAPPRARQLRCDARDQPWRFDGTRRESPRGGGGGGREV